MVPSIPSSEQTEFATVAVRNHLAAVIRAMATIVSLRVVVVFLKGALVPAMVLAKHALIPSMLRTSVVRCVHASREIADGSCHLLASASLPLREFTRLCAVGGDLANGGTGFPPE